MKKKIDPALNSLYTTIKERKKILGIFGLIFAIIGFAIMPIVTIYNLNTGISELKDFIAAQVINLIIFLLPALLMLKSWIDGPKTAKIIKLLTKKTEEIEFFDIEYISYNSNTQISTGIPDPYLVLYRKDKTKVSERILKNTEKDIIEFASKIAKRKVADQ